MPDSMRITERRVGDVTILALDGRLVLDDGDIPLRDYVNRLVAEGRVKIVLDLRRRDAPRQRRHRHAREQVPDGLSARAAA